MHLAFENSWAWVLGLPLAAAALALFLRSQRQAGRSGRQAGLLAACRAGAMLLLVLLAARPVLVESEKEVQQRNRVVLLVDRSASMSLEQEGQTRYRQAVELARRQLLPAIRAAGLRAEAFLFAEDVQAADGRQIAEARPDGKQTHMARAIAQAAGAGPPPLAVVALTDGVSTEDADKARAIAALAGEQVPFIGIGFGQESGAQVLSLERVTAPAVVSPKQEFRVVADLRVTGTRGLARFDLVLLRDGQFAARKTVAAGSGARAWQETFPVTEPEEKLLRYTVQLLPPADPALKCPSTSGAAAVRISGETEFRVLFVQGALTWDYKFIRLALAHDPAIKLSGLSRTTSQSQLFQSCDSDDDLPGSFPATMDELARFRVVVLSNIRPADLSPTQQELLARFCREFGGGVLLIGGGDTFNASWQRTTLEQLLPVRFSPAGYAAGALRIQLSEAALAHPVFQISDAGDNRRAWSALPAFEQHAVVDTVKPGAQVWAHSAAGPGPGRGPVLIASQQYGSGLSAVICVQNFWRWRLAKESNPQHFDRFWQQLLRFLSEGGRGPVTLSVPDQRLQPGTPIRVLLQRRPDPQSPPGARETFRVLVRDDGGRTVAEQNLELPPGGTAEATFTVERPGVFLISALDARGTVVGARSLELGTIEAEFVNTARNMESLRQWAALSDGLALPSEECENAGGLIGRIKDRIEQARQAPPRRLPAGVNAWTLLLLVGCLCVEWSLRKRWGLP